MINKNRKRGAENLFKELGSGKPRVLNKQQHHAYIHKWIWRGKMSAYSLLLNLPDLTPRISYTFRVFNMLPQK